MADKRRNLGIPSGVVFPFAGTVAPYGYLICDGRPVLRTEYSQLFLAVGTSHGQGDGSTTFNLPDYRGTFLRGRVDVITVTGSGTANSITNTATFTNHGLNRTGFRVRLSSGALTGLALSTNYYAIVVDSDTLAFATTLANAIAGTKVAISGANSAVIVQFEDPDADSRVEVNGGNSGNALGGRQEDKLQNITGGFDINRVITGNVTGAFTGTNNGDVCDGKGGTNYGDLRFDASRVARTSTETRPSNSLVNYIIKI